MQSNRLFKMLILGFLSFLIFILYRERFCTGDSLIYADNILRHRFNDISLHIGYYFLGYVFNTILKSAVSGIDQVLIIMSAVFGSLGLVYTFLLTEKLFRDSRLALFSALFLFLSGGYFAGGTGAEIYSAQTTFVIASLYYFHIKKYIPAGMIFGFSMLISPLSIFTAVIFPFSWIRRQCRLRDFLTFIIGTLIVFLPVFLAVVNDFLWGRRGLLRIAARTSYLDLSDVVHNIGFTFIKSFHIFSIFILIGLIYLFIRKRELFWLICVLNLPHLHLALKARGGGVLATFLLPIYFTYAILIAAGIWYSLDRWIKSRLRKFILMYATVILFGVISLLMRIGPVQLTHPRLKTENTFKNEIITFCQEIGESSIIVTRFAYGVAYAYYTRTDLSEELEATTGNRRWKDIDYLNPTSLGQLFVDFGNVYGLEYYSPGPATELFLNEQELRKRFNRHSLRSHLGKMRDDIKITDFHAGETSHIYKLSLAD